MNQNKTIFNRNIIRTIILHKQDIVFFILIAIAFFLKLWKAKYGISEYDEAFYLTIPHRMTMGDVLFVDEWHPSQMSGLILYPVFWLYMNFFGTTEGIQLAFRYIYVVFHLFVVLFLYYKIRKYGFLTTLGCALFFFFAPFQLMALSYNTFGLDFVVLSGVMMATYKYNKALDVIQLVVAGLFFAAAVICCPYLVVVYFIFLVVAFIIWINGKMRKNKEKKGSTIDAWSLKSVAFFSIGCFVLVMVFLLYIFIHMNLSTLFNNIKYILNDPEHIPMSFIEKTIIYFKQLILSANPLYLIMLFIYAISFFIMLFDKKRNAHKFIYLIIACAFTCAFLWFARAVLFNAFIIPISFLGLFAFMLSKDKKWNLFIWVYVLGVLYSFALNYSSNTTIYAIGIAFAVPSFCSFIFINEILEEILAEICINRSVFDKALIIIISITIVCYSSFEIFDTLNSCLWDGKVLFPHELSEKIENGPSKGIVSTIERKNQYEAVYSDIESIKQQERKPILCLTNQAWIYLALEDYEYAAFSAWLPEKDTTLTRLDEYYSMYPEKTPYIVYIPDNGNWDDIQMPVQYFETKGYVCDKLDSGYKLELKNHSQD